MINEYEAWVKSWNGEKWSSCRKVCSSAPLSTINLTQDGLGSTQIPVVSNQWLNASAMAQPQQGLRNRLLKGKFNSKNKFTGRGAKGLLMGKINFNVHGYLKILLFRRKIHEKKILITYPTGFKVCKSVHHRIIQINHQPDATIFQFIILMFIYSSTCFGCFSAHHQKHDCSGSHWFYLHIMVTVVLCSWSGRPNHKHSMTVTTIRR
jgi:hypothetical protein